MYCVSSVQRVHNACFYVTLERVGWPKDNKAGLPATMQLDFAKAEDAPKIGSSVWVEVSV
jgi:hypothetical protein